MHRAHLSKLPPRAVFISSRTILGWGNILDYIFSRILIEAMVGKWVEMQIKQIYTFGTMGAIKNTGEREE